MARYSTSEFRNGLRLMLEGDPCIILDNEFVRPGKGQAFSRVKFRNLRTGRVWERSLKSGESLEAADVVDVTLEYLYDDGNFWHFMDASTFEQHQADKAVVGEASQWLKAQDRCEATLFNGALLAVMPANFVDLRVTETDPGLKGDTAQGGSKPATLETGASVRVPLFIHPNDVIRVDTRTGDYVSRSKS